MLGLPAVPLRRLLEIGIGRRSEAASVRPVATPAPEPAPIEPMPLREVLGPGRNRAFRLPQFVVRVNGLRTAFFDAGAGLPLVFVHGLAADLTHWVNVAPRLAERFRVLGLDLPGCGASEAPSGPLSVKLYAAQLGGLLGRLGISRATIVGHSLGGMVAAELALADPARVGRLVLIDPAGFQRMPAWLRGAGHLALRPAILSTILPPLWKRVLDLVFGEPNAYTRAFVRSVEETYRTEDIHALARVIAGLRDDYLDRDFLGVFDRLRVPTLLIWGEKDLLTPAKPLRQAAARLPNVVAHEIRRCGHMPMIERPDVVLSLILRHVRQRVRDPVGEPASESIAS